MDDGPQETRRKRGDRKLRCRSGLPARRQSGPKSAKLLPTSVIRALDTALTDERNAHATCRAILDCFGDVRPFSNIIKTEAGHIAALERVYERYGLDASGGEGIANPAARTATLARFCQIAYESEIENTRFFDEALLPTVAEYPDIAALFRRLRNASWNRHRPAFARCAGRST